MCWTVMARLCYLAIAVQLLAIAAGCSTTSGLIFRNPPHRLLNSARLIAMATSPSWSEPRELATATLPEYRVGPGDVLALEPEDFDANLRLPGDQTVLPDGTIDLGPYGPIQVNRLTISEIQAKIEQRIEGHARGELSPIPLGGDEAEKKTRILVRLTEPASKVYYVAGEVNSPGAYPITGEETVLDAIFAAGDLTDQADRHRIILSRPTAPESCRRVLPVCYRHIVQLGDTSTNYQVQPGDRVFVASLTCWQGVLQTLFPFRGECCPACTVCEAGSATGVLFRGSADEACCGIP
jgi:polysaccharide export outer membrane protein